MGKPQDINPDHEPPNPEYTESVPSRVGYYDPSSWKNWVRPTKEPQAAKISQALHDPKKKYEESVIFTRYNRARERVIKSAIFSRFKGDWADSPLGWIITATAWFLVSLPAIAFILFMSIAILGVLAYFHRG
ncbi:hypothetical protein KAU08_06115 [bacterium]|nr:hypothetical protein [bacterium]